jgi:hypothetical protein
MQVELAPDATIDEAKQEIKFILADILKRAAKINTIISAQPSIANKWNTFLSTVRAFQGTADKTLEYNIQDAVIQTNTFDEQMTSWESVPESLSDISSHSATAKTISAAKSAKSKGIGLGFLILGIPVALLAFRGKR